MEIKIKVDDAETMAKLRKISPERFMRAWAIAVKNLARKRAQEAAAKSGGRSFWQREILPSVHEEVNPASARVYSDSHIAEHVHTGGVIRSRLRKYLAIPLDKKLKKKGPKEVPWHTPKGEPVFRPRKYGPGWVLLDYQGRGRNRKYVPKFALVPETRPQKPRPWWPEEWEVKDLTEQYISEIFSQ